jgi:HSP20 family protein
MSHAKTNSTIGHWMEDFFRPDWSPFAGLNRQTGDMPAVNIHESKDAYTIEAAVPGFAKDEIRLQIENGMLTISGEHQTQAPAAEVKDEKTTRREFSYNLFSRSFSLPADALENDIDASWDKGILHIRLPRQQAESTSPQTKTIAIR